MGSSKGLSIWTLLIECSESGGRLSPKLSKSSTFLLIYTFMPFEHIFVYLSLQCLPASLHYGLYITCFFPISENHQPLKLPVQWALQKALHELTKICWESAGSPLAVCWLSAGSPLAVRWESAGNPLGIHWESAGSSLNGLSIRALQMSSFISGAITTLDCNLYYSSDCNIS